MNNPFFRDKTTHAGLLSALICLCLRPWALPGRLITSTLSLNVYTYHSSHSVIQVETQEASVHIRAFG